MSAETTWIRDVAVIVPIAVVATGMLVVRTSALTASVLGIGTAVLMSLWAGFEWRPANVREMVFASLLLTANVAMVIVPGLAFSALVRRHGLTRGLARWVRRLPVSREGKTLLVVLGLAPAIESLTGFGVSMFVTVPILYPLYSWARTARLGLLSMNIMPWGTLGLATSVGAMLVGRESGHLGVLTGFTSALVFPYIGAVTAWYVSDRPDGRRLMLGLGLGGLLSLALIVCNWLLGVEAAGVVSGAVVSVVGLVFLKSGAVRLRPGLLVLWPYMLLLALVLVQRLTPGLHAGLAEAWVLRADGVRFSPLTSPGILMALAATTLFFRRPSRRIDVKNILVKASTILASVGLFLLLSQVLVQTGMLDSFVARMGRGLTEAQMIVVSVLLGGLSGFTTGSNVGGNALLVAAQYRAGLAGGGGEDTAGLLAALQNSGAGHAVFSSLPIIVLLLGILRDESGGAGPAEHELLRFALRTVLGIVLLITVAGLLLAKILPAMP